MSLWTRDQIVKATEGTCASAFQVEGVSIDSRTLEKGDLFVALQGGNGDGIAYVKDALAKGAAAALVSQVPEEMSASDPLVVVPDTLLALQKMGIEARKRATHAIRIGVTGSVGKTGTKEMLKLVLGEQGKTTANVSSYNNHWGVPLTLSRMPEDTDYGVFEMGMNHHGEIRPLTEMVQPHVAVITTVAESHAAFFKDLEDIARAKAEIFEGVVPGGAAVLNRDHPLYDFLVTKAKAAGIEKIYGFGEHEGADCRLLESTLSPTDSHVTVSLFGETFSYRMPIPGRHWVMNSLAVLLAVHLAGGDEKKAAHSLSKITPPQGRGLRHEISFAKGSFLLIDEAYNANPASMAAALAVLGQTEPLRGGRRIAVIGHMVELGEISENRHAGLSVPVMAAQVDRVYCCGPHMKKLAEALPASLLALHQETSIQLIEPLLKDLQDGDVVMVKGSLSTRMAPIVAALKAVV